MESKIKITYILILLNIIIFISALFIAKPLMHYKHEIEYYRLKKDVEIYNRKNISFGVLKKGLIIKKVPYYDFYDTKRKIKYKLVIMPENMIEFMNYKIESNNDYEVYRAE